MNWTNYFDHAATTPLSPRVFEAMLPYLREIHGNPSSPHHYGQSAQEAITRARQRIATCIGAEDPSQIIFTSGATEANNWILRNYPNAAVSPFEHSSLFETAVALGKDFLTNSHYHLHPAPGAGLACVMAVNNETGACLEWPHEIPRHTDITQALGHVSCHVGSCYSTSFSAHKLGGPKGVGFLYHCEPWNLGPSAMGGEQEFGLRAGTLNVASIIGMAEAIETGVDEQPELQAHCGRLRETVLDELQQVTDWMTDPVQTRSDHILSVSFAGIEAALLVVELDALGFGVSSGAACSTHSNETSHVLKALDYPDEFARGTLRISFGWENNLDATFNLAKSVVSSVTRLRSLKV